METPHPLRDWRRQGRKGIGMGRSGKHAATDAADAGRALGKLPSARRRGAILSDSRWGIPLNCRGGRGYDRDMRRLVADGLARIERDGLRAQYGFGQNTSRLVPTEAGRDRLRRAGLDPDEPRPDPGPLSYAW